jgi:hypothetical protein
MRRREEKMRRREEKMRRREEKMRRREEKMRKGEGKKRRRQVKRRRKESLKRKREEEGITKKKGMYKWKGYGEGGGEKSRGVCYEEEKKLEGIRGKR